MSSTFYCLLLTTLRPVDDFLWSYSHWFVSQLKVEAPPCLPSSPAELLTVFVCFKAPRTKVSTIPLRNCLRICGRDSQSLWTIASFQACFSSLHPQKMEAVDGATGRPLSLICPVKSAGAAKAEFAGALQTRWSCQIIPSFQPLRRPTETIT